MLPANALKLLYQGAKKGILRQDLVNAFINMLGLYPVSSCVLLNTGEKALVREASGDNTRPVIKICYDCKGFAMSDALVVDLSRQNATAPARNIVEVLDPQHQSCDPAGLLRQVTEAKSDV